MHEVMWLRNCPHWERQPRGSLLVKRSRLEPSLDYGVVPSTRRMTIGARLLLPVFTFCLFNRAKVGVAHTVVLTSVKAIRVVSIPSSETPSNNRRFEGGRVCGIMEISAQKVNALSHTIARSLSCDHCYSKAKYARCIRSKTKTQRTKIPTHGVNEKRE